MTVRSFIPTVAGLLLIAAGRALAADGTLCLTTEPSSATIQFIGIDAPQFQQNMSLRPGTYGLDVAAEGYLTARVWAEVSLQSQACQRVVLQPQRGTLVLGLWPFGLNMEVLAAPPTFDGTLPSSLDEPLQWPIGEYRLRFSKQGYEPRDVKVLLQADQERAVSVVLIAVARQAGEVFSDLLVDGGYGPELVVVPAGSFTMGDLTGNGLEQERPTLRRELPRALAIGRYEVTIGEYRRFARATNRVEPSGDDRLPISNVSYDEAQAYTQWLSAQTGEQYRLPWEYEWEYAARGGVTTDFVYGDDLDCEQAQFDGLLGCPQHAGLVEVGSYAASTFGLFDVHGNVAEWTADCYRENLAEERGDCHKAAVRGGSWMLVSHKVRLSYRNWRYRDFSNADTGFRVVRDL